MYHPEGFLPKGCQWTAVEWQWQWSHGVGQRLPFTSSVILFYTLHFSKPQFVHLENEDNNAYLIGLFWGSREMMGTQCLQLCLALSRYSANGGLHCHSPISQYAPYYHHGQSKMYISGWVFFSPWIIPAIFLLDDICKGALLDPVGSCFRRVFRKII